jgi:hypothetical protein
MEMVNVKHGLLRSWVVLSLIWIAYSGLGVGVECYNYPDLAFVDWSGYIGIILLPPVVSLLLVL